MKTVYAIPNYECNLACSHCTIHSKKIEYNECEYLKTLKNLDDNDVVILFGGEPTLFEDRFYSSFFTGKIKTISTNLVDISPNILKTIATSNILLSTSWNIVRFSNIQYKKWLNNLSEYGKYSKKCMVMITMTEDLIKDENFEYFLSVLNDINRTNAVDKILFEHLISDNDLTIHHQLCDKWLCKVHEHWNFSFENFLETKLKHNWICDCKNVYTLEPNGQLYQKCPHGTGTKINLKCLTCNNSVICKPCKIQNACNFPQMLFNKINEQ